MNIKDYKKTDNFQPVAMKCTEEQFNEMKQILEGFGLSLKDVWGCFKEYNYLTNFGYGDTNNIANVANGENKKYERTVIPHNQEAFLKACGIERIEYPEINLSKITPDLIRELNKEPNIHDILVKDGVVVEKPKPAYIQVPISEIDSLSSKKLGRFVKELASKY